MKRTFILIVLAVSVFLSGCRKNETEVKPEPVAGTVKDICFSSHTRGTATGIGTDLGQSFSVCSFLEGKGSREVWFEFTEFSYADRQYTGAASCYWPTIADVNLDFYAVSPLTYRNTAEVQESVTLKLETADSSFTVTGTDGKTDILAARLTDVSGVNDSVRLEFSHTLTKVSFKVSGADSRYVYKIDSITLTANSSAKYTFGAGDCWGASSDEFNYTVLGTGKTIPAGIRSALSAGDPLYLIPNQPSSVSARVRYSVYHSSLRIDTTLTPVVTDLPVTKSWNAGKSIIYVLNLDLPSSASPITFSETGYVWDDEPEPEPEQELEPEMSLGDTLVAYYDVKSTDLIPIVHDTYPVSEMIIDDTVKIKPTERYAFPSVGMHKVTYVLKWNTCGSMFDSGALSALKTIDWTHIHNPMASLYFSFNHCPVENFIGFENVTVLGYTTAAFQYCSRLKHLNLPRCKQIGRFMINHLSGIDNTTITIPASVETIGCSHVFYDTGRSGIFTRFEVEPGNTHFKTINGSLYSMDGKDFIACPLSPEVTDDTFVLAEGVERTGELCFNRAANFHKLLLPDSYTITEYCAGQITEGINWGNSLSVALYSFTAVTDYLVKDSNTKYISDGGCIYSKDGTHLIAVPNKRTGMIMVREGCTHINREAFWEEALTQVNASPNCSGISIPASVISISDGQISGINNMVDKRNWNVIIAAGNPVYEVVGGKIALK